MKFLVDMPLSPALAAWLNEQGHDAVHAGDVGLGGAADTELLSRAKQEGRTIVTADLDYPRLLALGQADGPSLILFRDGNWSDAAVLARMGELLRAMTGAEIARSVVVVERARVRRRELPI